MSKDFNRVWEPPLSCMRRNCRLINANNTIIDRKLLFPLELTDVDYFRRLLDVLNNGLFDLVKDVLTKAKYDDNYIDTIRHTILYEMLQKVTIGNQAIKICDVISQTLNLSNSDRNKLSNSIEAFLKKDKSISKMVETHTLSASGPIVDAFKLGKEILLICGGTLESRAGLNSRLSLALQEIIHLEDQRLLHSDFKESRLNILGWNKKTDDLFESSNTSENNANLKLSQLEEILGNEKKKSLIILVHRLKAFSKDIFSLTTSILSEANPIEFSEIQRLQGIATCLQEIVMEPSACKSLDAANSLYTSSLKVVSDLLREVEKEKFNDIEKAKVISHPSFNFLLVIYFLL